MDIISILQIKRNKALSESMEMEMGINETRQNGLTFTIDYLCALMANFFGLAIPSHSQDFTIPDGNPLGLWESRIHSNDIGIVENKICHEIGNCG
jgi:hypothetical protein